MDLTSLLAGAGGTLLGGPIGGGLAMAGLDLSRGHNPISDLGDGIGNVWNGLTGVTASRNATNQQVAGINNAINALNTQNDKAQGYLQPYLGYGQAGANSLQNLLNAPGYGGSAPDINASQFNQGVRPDAYQAPAAFQATAFKGVDDPGIAYAQSQALDAAQKSAAAKGMLGSSNTLKTIQNNAGDIANKYYGDAYNRNLQGNQQAFDQYANQRNFGKNIYDTNLGQYNTDVNNGLNRFQTAQGQYQNGFNNFLANRGQQGSLSNMLLGSGQQAANDMSNISQNYGNNLANLYTGRGTAQAQGTLGQYNDQKGFLTSLLGGAKDAAGIAAAAGLIG
jgi:hypothetical protein